MANNRISGFVEQGNQSAVTQGLSSSNKLQASYPTAVVTVFDHGTLTPSTIFSDAAGTAKANPFSPSANGYWFFYGPAGTHYDIQFSGVGFTTFSLTDVLSPMAGGAGIGTVTSVAATVPTFMSIAGSPITTSGTLAFSLSGSPLATPIWDDGGWVFNGAAAGMIGDDSTDNSAVLQALITSLIALGGGKIVVPSGVYRFSGALQSGSNSIIKFPARSLLVEGISIEIEGTVAPAIVSFTGPPSETGVVFRYMTAGSGTRPALFGVEASGGSFSNYTISFKNLTMRSGISNPSLGAINARDVWRLLMTNVSVDTGTNPPTEPTNAGLTAIIMPIISNDVQMLIDSVGVTGYPVGLSFSEHVNFRNLYMIECSTGVVAVSGNYPSTGNMIFFLCPEGLRFDGATTVDFMLGIEDTVIGGWPAHTAGHSIFDPSNLGHGTIQCRRLVDAASVIVLSNTGCQNLTIVEMFTGFMTRSTNIDTQNAINVASRNAAVNNASFARMQVSADTVAGYFTAFSSTHIIAALRNSVSFAADQILRFISGAAGVAKDMEFYTDSGTTVAFKLKGQAGIPVFANNAAALAGGLTVGHLYRTNGDPDLICIVH